MSKGRGPRGTGPPPRSGAPPAALAETLRKALALQQQGALAEAEALYKSVLARQPGNFDALHLMGVLELQRRRPDAAAALIGRALAVNPKSAAAHGNLGNALSGLRRYEEAVASYDRALALRPDFAEAFNNRGNALDSLRRHEAALASYDRALALRPDFADALSNRASVLMSLRRFEEAAAALERLQALGTGHAFVAGRLLRARLHCCAWDGYDAAVALAATEAGQRGIMPFDMLAISPSPADLRRAAEFWMCAKCPPAAAPLWRGERYRHERIRLAYVSGDFHDHAIMRLMARLFELHDRARFETTALSFGPADGGAMRARLEAAFEHFIDVRQQSDPEIAALIRAREIDIAVDLTGFTAGGRTGILALRPAPIQVSYIGYPGTMGAPYIDYILADRCVIPPEHAPHYAEHVVHLPDSYLVQDGTRQIAGRAPPRAACGLPEAGFVFCSFNNNYKIAPFMFDAWMRLLRAVEGSVLWLIEDNAAAARNLRREAERRGVAPQRLVFAPRVAADAHLARQRCADLFLDTLPYGAHTTAGDALWAGLPLVTCLGSTFVGRVAASLLEAAGLPELVTRSLDGYEALALALARDPARLAALRARLEANRERLPLFDTDRSRRHIESAYRTMWERWQRGEPPAAFAVPPAAA
ncbi:MAG TPA: tetratricopeptide repeat protein [Stellaceae bacterium]|nr:tetratricopeptide repeat protein [Stellaceae bacterium]